MAPAHGPVAGGTQVVVAVAWDAAAAQPDGADWHLCRFGAASVAATLDATGGSFACVAPPHSAGWAAVALSVNGVDFVGGGVAFRFDAAKVLALTPARAPAVGGASLRVAVEALAVAEQGSLRCVFGGGGAADEWSEACA
jgi:hypothetical protein